MRSRSLISCARFARYGPVLPALHSSAIFAPGDAVDEYPHRLTLLVSGSYAEIRPSVVDGARRKASYHHVAIGRLVLEGGAGVGEGGVILCDPLDVALAPRVLAGKRGMIDEVGREQFV